MADSKREEPYGEELAPLSDEYEAGHAARFRDEAMCIGATASWQAGWTDANRELGRFDEAFTSAQVSLPFFGTGEEARRRGLPFEPACSDAWKQGWVEADIALGLSDTASD
ncbi:MAG: hypothetical protein ACRYGF_16990 [Janthinobacterium lividum]